MCIYIYIHVCVCIYLLIYLYIYIYIFIYLFAYMCVVKSQLSLRSNPMLSFANSSLRWLKPQLAGAEVDDLAPTAKLIFTNLGGALECAF